MLHYMDMTHLWISLQFVAICRLKGPMKCGGTDVTSRHGVIATYSYIRRGWYRFVCV